MKRWAVLTVLLYAFALILLTLPVVLIAFANWGLKESHPGIRDALQIYAQWGYWLWLAVLVAGQFLLLLVPIDLSERRLPSRRKLKVPVIVGAFFLGNLFLAGLVSLLCAVFRDNGFEIFTFVDRIGHLFRPQATSQETNWGDIASIIIVTVMFWIIWAIIFRRATRKDDPAALMQRLKRWLLPGSILELLVAVPSHIIVRRRDDCCAPFGTFWGIATGISVMLLCFGPGVFFLFIERFGRLQPKSPDPAKPPAQN